MAVRKTIEDVIVVEGERADWFERCKGALAKGVFTAIQAKEAFGQISGDYKKMTVWGQIEITLMPENGTTKIVTKATANVDNIYALFSSPGKTIIDAFKSDLA